MSTRNNNDWQEEKHPGTTQNSTPEKRVRVINWSNTPKKAIVRSEKIDLGNLPMILASVVIAAGLIGIILFYKSTISDGKNAKELAAIAARNGLATTALQTFVDGILDRMIFDGEHLSDLMAPLDLGWKARTQAELALMADLHLLLTKRAGGRDISGLSAYEI